MPVRSVAGIRRAAVGAMILLLAALPAWCATLTYDFNNGTLQGWHNRVWDLSANGGAGGWVDLAPNVTGMPGTINGGVIQPPSPDDQLFGNNGSQIDPVGGQNDNHQNSIWLRSPQFTLDASGNLTAQLARGRAHGNAPANDLSVAFTADTTGDGNDPGWKGVLLRRVSDGAFILAKPRTSEGDAFATVTFTTAELAPFVGVNCTLDMLNSERGGWGWLSMDNVSIPGTLVPPADVAVSSPSVVLGSNATVTVSIPSGLNATVPVTVYLTNSNPGVVTLGGSSASVITLTFGAGGASSQNVTATGAALGYAKFTTGSSGLVSDTDGLTVLTRTGIIGRWLTGSEDLQDKSGYMPGGVHDGVLSDGLTPSFSTDVPPGATGSSLYLFGSGGAVLISNSVVTAAGYQPTFDEGVAQQLSVAFWAKYEPGTWNPFISKNGEGSTGWQVRKRGDQSVPTFTLRSTGGEDDPYNASALLNDGNWHYFVASWDGVAGIRKLYVDGKLNITVPHDSGPMGIANANYLTLGGRTGAGSSTPGNTFLGQLYDVRIYGTALPGSAAQSLFIANSNAVVAYADTSAISTGQTGVVSISIPASANASSSVTVFVTNTTPTVASLAGAVGNVLALTFPAGGVINQTVSITGLTEGQAQFACAASGLTSGSATVNVWGQHLIGHWFDGTENYTDSSGFAPPGTHDGAEVGTFGNLTFSADTPPSKSGKSAQFGGGVGLMINNSSVFDAAYAPTFDDVIASRFSLSFWAKGIPGTWNPFISKRGEDAIGWQMRRSGGITEAFTLRGSGSGNADGVGSVEINDGKWHHFAAVWDGQTGTRKCYIDGILDPSVNLTNDFAPMMMAANHHLVLGGREQGAVSAFPMYEGFYSGLMFDVRMYNYPLSDSEVKTLSFIPAIKVAAAKRSLHAPEMTTVDIILPAGANQSQAISVQVHNDKPAIASLTGAVGDIVTLNFPIGGSLTQQVTVAGIADGKGSLTASGGGFINGIGTFNVWADPGNKLVGHWFTGEQSFAETSGFRPPGTHDAVPVAANGADPSYVIFSPDVPPGFPEGYSLDLMSYGGNVAVVITNTSTANADYVETFDNQISNKFSIAFWAKGPTPSTEDWNAWVSKRGEDNLGYQVRRNGGSNPVQPTFTIRGTVGDDDPAGAGLDTSAWHHYAATWDGTTGARRLYVDGVLALGFDQDFGPLAMAPANYLMLGGLDTGSFRRFFPCLLYDVRMYSYALDSVAVGLLANPPTSLSLSVPQLNIALGQTVHLTVTVPAGATASSSVTVHLTNNSPGVVSFVGSMGNTLDVVFPIGSVVQTVDLLAIGVGTVDISAGAAAIGTAQLATVNTVVQPNLVGRWLTGAADLADKSGFTTPGTHDGVAVGPNAASLAFSSDVPAGFTGQSLDLTAGNVGVEVSNTANTDASYLPTFDTDIQDTFTVAFWAKGFPADWSPWVSKRGESGIGWQLRRWAGNPYACFTVRGLDNEDGTGSTIDVATGQPKWHHFVGVFNQYNGTRALYVDGVLSHIVYNNPTEIMTLAADKHLALGTRQGGGVDYEGYFPGLLYDVRVYDYALAASDVSSLLVPPVSNIPTLKIQPWTGSQVRISWPTAAAGFAVEQSSALTTGWGPSGLVVTVEGSENVAYAPATSGPLFFRLKK